MQTVPLTLGVYGLAFFFLLFFHEQIPKEFRLYYQGIYTTLEYLVFSYLLYLNLERNRFRKIIVISSVLFILFQIIYTTTQDLKKLDSIPIAIETILLFIYIFLFFLESSRKLNSGYIYNHHCFWLAVGILIYLGGSFFFYILINHLNEEQITTFGNLTWFAEIVKNIFFSIAIIFFIRFPEANNKNKKKEVSIPYLDMI
jgi:FtsH-binding integral membrane protein